MYIKRKDKVYDMYLEIRAVVDKNVAEVIGSVGEKGRRHTALPPVVSVG